MYRFVLSELYPTKGCEDGALLFCIRHKSGLKTLIGFQGVLTQSSAPVVVQLTEECLPLILNEARCEVGIATYEFQEGKDPHVLMRSDIPGDYKVGSLRIFIGKEPPMLNNVSRDWPGSVLG